MGHVGTKINDELHGKFLMICKIRGKKLGEVLAEMIEGFVAEAESKQRHRMGAGREGIGEKAESIFGRRLKRL